MIGREVAVNLVVGAGHEHVSGEVEVEEAASVVEDVWAEHDVFVSAAREVEVGCLDIDTSDKGHRGTGAEGRFENGRSTREVRGDQRV